MRWRNMTAIYLRCGEKILLLYRQGSKVANDMWIGAAGGHFEAEELNDPTGCVLRELQEELNITKDMLKNFRLRYVTLRRMKDEVRQNYYFFAELEGGEQLELVSNEGRLQWFELCELSELSMPFSARFMMDHYVETGRFDDKLYGGVSDGTKIEFVEMKEG